jgi:hypothetical protein
MAIVEYKDPTLSDSVDRYVCSQKRTSRPISLREGVQALRTLSIKCYVTDRELAEMIAATAIRYGQDVTFDWTGTED